MRTASMVLAAILAISGIGRPGSALGQVSVARRLVAGLAAAFMLAAAAAAAEALRQKRIRAADTILARMRRSWKRVTPAVVNVYASRTETRRPRNPLLDDPFFRSNSSEMLAGTGEPPNHWGPGVLVDHSGLIVTNHHVIEGMTDVKVALSDKREFEADIVLSDPSSDLAVLKIKGGSNFPVLDFGDSDALDVGDLVLAIGNPFAVGQTVTQEHHLGFGADAARGRCRLRWFLHSDGCCHKPRQFRRRPRRYARASRRYQFGDLFALRRVDGNWIRYSSQYGEGRRCRSERRRQASTAAVARRIVPGRLPGHCRIRSGISRPTGALVGDVFENSPAANAPD